MWRHAMHIYFHATPNVSPLTSDWKLRCNDYLQLVLYVAHKTSQSVNNFPTRL